MTNSVLILQVNVLGYISVFGSARSVPCRVRSPLLLSPFAGRQETYAAESSPICPWCTPPPVPSRAEGREREAGKKVPGWDARGRLRALLEILIMIGGNDEGRTDGEVFSARKSLFSLPKHGTALLFTKINAVYTVIYMESKFNFLKKNSCYLVRSPQIIISNVKVVNKHSFFGNRKS